MPSGLTSVEQRDDTRNVSNLLNIYRSDVQPLEEMYSYNALKPGTFEDSILNQRPMITFLGPWSAGKTSLINHLLQEDHLYTGPQPTTSDFTAVLYGPEAGHVDSAALVNNANLPFRNLQGYGQDFLSSFKGYQAPHNLLRHCTLIDTPGVLENADDMHQRKYNYHNMARWFVQKSELVFVLFDPSKLDTGVELRLLFEQSLRGYEHKVRIILNKADQLTSPELMKVYGALLWNLSGIMSTPEPPRIYVGSFWNKPYAQGSFTRLFTEEKEDLMKEILVDVPRQFWDRKVSAVLNRSKLVLAHAGVVSKMREHNSIFTSGSSQRKSAIKNLDKTYSEIAAKYSLLKMEFPDPSEYEAFLDKVKLDDFSSIDKAEKNGMIKRILAAIHVTLPDMLKPVRGATVVPKDANSERQQLSKMYSTYNQSRGGFSQNGDQQNGISPNSFSQASTLPSTNNRQTEMMTQMMLMMQQMKEKKKNGGSSQNSTSSTPLPQRTNGTFFPPVKEEQQSLSAQPSFGYQRQSPSTEEFVQLPSI